MDVKPIRIVIADSHDLFRQGLASLLSRQEGIQVVGEAHDGDEARAMTANLGPDVLLGVAATGPSSGVAIWGMRP